MEVKVCACCWEEKPATLEYFYKNSKLKSGLSSYCKECNLLMRKESYKNKIINNGGEYKPRKTKITKEGYKHCTKCGNIKELNSDNFRRNKSLKDGYEYWCKDCMKENAKMVYRRKIERMYKVG